MKKGFARYYQQFEPAWANKLVLDQDDIKFGLTILLGICPGGTSMPYLNLLKTQAVRITDEAIAHALRESHN